MVGNFNADVRSAIAGGGIDGVLHYSPRTAGAFIAAAVAAGIMDSAMEISHFCLSSQVAAPLSAAGAATVTIAGAPNEAALLALIDMP
jgi:uroporphyrinogen-III synthase